ncbi:MAG TPA: hypothetical protein VGM56_21645 [Byssovorax sp.]|jgi:hypothetical protein
MSDGPKSTRGRIRDELAALGLEFATWTPERLRDAAQTCRFRSQRIRAEVGRGENPPDETPEARLASAAQYERTADLCDIAASQLEVT